MKRLLGFSVLLLGSWLAQPASAQAPAGNVGPQTRPQPASVQAPARSVGPQTRQATAFRRDAPARPVSVARHQAYYRGYNEDSSRPGYRNPGGVGRYEEFYPAGNRFQNEGHNPVPVATFNGGSGVPTVQEQIYAQQLGVAKYNSIQQSIDRYGRPMFGFGFFGGFN